MNFYIASRLAGRKPKTTIPAKHSKAKTLTQSDEAFLARMNGNVIFQSGAYQPMAFAN